MNVSIGINKNFFQPSAEAMDIRVTDHYLCDFWLRVSSASNGVLDSTMSWLILQMDVHGKLIKLFDNIFVFHSKV